jgi:hypothetical protein
MVYSKYIAVLLVGIVIGFYLYDWLLAPEVKSETIIKETIKTDTVWMVQKDTVYLDRTKIIHEYLRDTIIENYRPEINRFSATLPFLYGNVYINGQVLGQILQMNANSDFKIPRIETTINREKTVTNTIIQKGVFAGAGFSNQFDYHIAASYLGNGFTANVSYTPNPKHIETPLIQADIRLNVFKLRK